MAAPQCDDCMVPEVICHQAGNIRDAGYSVSIESGGFTGITFAHVSRITIAGSQPVLSEPVTPQPTRDAKLIAYKGNGFGLVIDRSRDIAGYFPAVVNFKAQRSLVKDDLLCSFR